MTQTVEIPEVTKKRLGNGGLIGLVLALAASAGIGGVALRGTSTEADYPAAWDPRVTALVSYVEDHRGLKFKHPVYVEFQTDAAFTKAVTTRDEDLNDDQRKSLEQANGMVRALGLMSGGEDLLDLMNHNDSGSTIGFYSYVDKKIRVRGDQVTPYTKVTLVHELTHVLQDQYFDLEREMKRLHESTTVDDTAYRSIVEGDARRIEDGYRGSLSRADAKAVDAEEAKFAKGSEDDLKNVPEFLQISQYAPYPLGNAVVAGAFADGGNKAVDALFQKAPEHDIQILDPWLLDDSRWKPTPVTAPALGAGEKEVDRGTFGVLSLYLLLTKGNPVGDALVTAEGDGGDLYLDYTKNDVSCTRATFAGISPAAATKIEVALNNWAKAARTGATVAITGVEVTLNACDPGKAYKASGDRSGEGLYVLTLRNGIVAGTAKKAKDKVAAAVCFANNIVRAWTPTELRSIDSGAVKPDQSTLLAAVSACK